MPLSAPLCCRLEGGYSPRRWWNYLRRQLYVLDTYANPHNRRTNHTLALFHSYAAWGVVLPTVTGGWVGGWVAAVCVCRCVAGTRLHCRLLVGVLSQCLQLWCPTACGALPLCYGRRPTF